MTSPIHDKLSSQTYPKVENSEGFNKSTKLNDNEGNLFMNQRPKKCSQQSFQKITNIFLKMQNLQTNQYLPPGCWPHSPLLTNYSFGAPASQLSATIKSPGQGGGQGAGGPTGQSSAVPACWTLWRSQSHSVHVL